MLWESNGKIIILFLFSGTCFVDKSQVWSFDKLQYHLQLDQCWHVAVTSYPKNNPDSSSQRLPIPENMNIAILIRENENHQRDLKIVLGDKVIEFSVSEGRQIQVEINGKKVNYSKEQSQQERKDGEIVYEFFELPDKSVKFISGMFDIEIIYDGERSKIKV